MTAFNDRIKKILMVILFIILLWVTYVMAELREQRTFIIDKEELEERLQKELYKND